MIEIGTICVKIAGRDANKKCVVVDVLDNRFVMIDGETRRRKCNVLHIEPLKGRLDIEKGASHEKIAEEFSKIGWKVREIKQKEVKEKPVKKRAKKKAEKASKVPKKKKEKKVVDAEVKGDKPKAAAKKDKAEKKA